jgi:hypothetical protein
MLEKGLGLGSLSLDNGRTYLNAERRALRGLAEASKHVPANVAHRLGEPNCGGALTLAWTNEYWHRARNAPKGVGVMPVTTT